MAEMGKHQLGVLRMLQGSFYPGGGWTHGHASEGERIMQSLERRGLVSQDADGIYRLTDAGLAQVEADRRASVEAQGGCTHGRPSRVQCDECMGVTA